MNFFGNFQAYSATEFFGRKGHRFQGRLGTFVALCGRPARP
jgi:hypothetical protein